MSAIKVALILAAGNGSRLVQVSGGKPKPLVELHGQPLLEHVLVGVQEAGIQRCVVVVGYRGDLIRSWVARRRFRGLQIEVVENHEYTRENGLSVMQAEPLINEPFLMLMADHVFEPETAAALVEEPIAQDEVILAVDRKIDEIFDLDDATKVVCQNGFITDIGKNLQVYNAIDTGMFLCSPILFSSLRAMIDAGKCSLSDGIRLMSRRRKVRAFDIGNAIWQDADTPEALAHAGVMFAENCGPTSMLEEAQLA
jgi:1L-myo-inositol 1-phosphate cytidylyltransferase